MAGELVGERIEFGRQTMLDRVAAWAARTPGALALEGSGGSLSYGDLDVRAGAIGHTLAQAGVGPGDVVALELSRSVDLVAAILGVWRAGAAYLPIEPEWPAERRAALLAQASPAVLLSNVRREGDRATPWRELPLADVPPSPDDEAERGSGPAPDDLAYVIYTSGSTGTPKGVAVEHRQLSNYVAAATAAMGLDACRRWALTTSVAADLGNTALFGALFTGGCLVVATDEEVTQPAAFARFLAERRIDAVKMTPSHLDALLDGEPASLPRTLVLGGEPMPRSLITRIRRIAPDTRIFNHYGPTETTIGVIVHAVPDGPSIPDVQPLTDVLANNRLRILDDDLRTVPVDGIGELYIGGAQICRGYLHAGHDRAFVADPFAPGERLYRTGDLVRVLAEGGIRWIGRADHQVKIRGFRVDPAEVEAALAVQPGVKQGVVVSVRPADRPVELVACVVAESLAEAEAVMRAARERLRALLPEHMVPSRWVAREQFARLPNGKIDRVGLAASLIPVDEEAGPPASAGALETLLAQGIGSLLGRGAVGPDENLFDLGLHSLLIIRLVARIRRMLQIDVAPAFIFDHPTVTELAAALRQKADDPAALDTRALAALPSLAALAPQGVAAAGVS